MAGDGLLVTGRIATLAGTAGPGWVEAIASAPGVSSPPGREVDREAARRPARRARLRARSRRGRASPASPTPTCTWPRPRSRSRRVDLGDARSIETLVERVRAAAAAHRRRRDLDHWAQGWDADLLGAWPTAGDLDRAAPGRLVALWAHDHHALS